MDSFNNFANYYNQLNNSMTGTTQLVNKLQQFIGTTENINVVLEGIKNNIETSNSATKFFNTHIETFSKYGDAVNEAVISSESKMAKAINELGRLSQEQFNSFNEAIAGFDSKLSKAFTHSIEKFTEAMDNQILRTEQAFENSRPKFEKLDHLVQLERLESIDGGLENLKKDLSLVFKNNSQDIIAAIQKMNTSKEWPVSVSSAVSSPKVLKPIKKSKLEFVLIILKIGAYITILSYGIQSMLIFFNII
jgi:ABC-type transporter Mla subunit MlaD